MHVAFKNKKILQKRLCYENVKQRVHEMSGKQCSKPIPQPFLWNIYSTLHTTKHS